MFVARVVPVAPVATLLEERLVYVNGYFPVYATLFCPTYTTKEISELSYSWTADITSAPVKVLPSKDEFIWFCNALEIL